MCAIAYTRDDITLEFIMLPSLLSLPGSLGLTAALLPLQTGDLLTGLDRVLASPNVAYLLLVMGFLGLFLEASAPGTSVPGVVGVICLVLAAIGLFQLPFDWHGAVLILVAFFLFFADIFVPSLGLLTLTGLALLVAGSYFLFDEARGAAVSRPLIWATTLAIVAMFLVIGGFALSVWRRKPETGRESLIGAVGTVRQTLAPDGIIFIRGELWQATATDLAGNPAIDARVPVTVTGIDGLRLLVRRATAPEAAAAGVAVVGDARPVVTAESGAPLAGAP
jgi:membrane-bound serine protease (ClpP class)